MARKYEIVYIFSNELDEAQVNERLERFHALLKSADTSEPVTSVNHWGKRTLAYAIKRNEVGYYVVASLATEPSLLGEFERALKLDETLLRHLIVLNEGLVGAAPRASVDATSPRKDGGE